MFKTKMVLETIFEKNCEKKYVKY